MPTERLLTVDVCQEELARRRERWTAAGATLHRRRAAQVRPAGLEREPWRGDRSLARRPPTARGPPPEAAVSGVLADRLLRAVRGAGGGGGGRAGPRRSTAPDARDGGRRSDRLATPIMQSLSVARVRGDRDSARAAAEPEAVHDPPPVRGRRLCGRDPERLGDVRAWPSSSFSGPVLASSPASARRRLVLLPFGPRHDGSAGLRSRRPDLVRALGQARGAWPVRRRGVLPPDRLLAGVSGRHWPTDVAGGLLLGTGWAAMWIWWWERAGRRG